MSIKCLKRYWLRNLLKCCFIGEYHCCVRFYFIDYNYVFNALQEWNDYFATVNKMKSWKNAYFFNFIDLEFDLL